MMSRQPVLSEQEVWRKYDDTERRLTAHLSERMLDLAGISTGMRVLDIATGRGEPAIPAAHRVGPGGLVLGVDRSTANLQIAAERAAKEGLTNLDLRVANAETLEGVPKAHFHAALCRWGLMYFESPLAALTAARSTMLPGALMVSAVWTEPQRVPYFTFPRQVLSRYAPIAQIDFEAPGPFRYADANILTRDLHSAGFKVEHLEELDIPVMEALDGREVVEWTRAFGLTKLLNEHPEELQRRWETDLSNEAEKLRADGFIRLGGVTRIAVASAL